MLHGCDKHTQPAWWYLATRVCAGVVTPRIDIETADHRLDEILRDSVIWSAASRAAAKIDWAWRDSLVRACAVSALSAWPESVAGRYRVIGWVQAIAGATALATQAFRPAGIEPFSWALPAAVLAGGVVLLAVSGRSPSTAASRNA